MHYWNEPRQKKRTCACSMSQSRRFKGNILYPDASTPDYEVYAERWIKEGEPLSWVGVPEGWEELWPHTRILSENWRQVRQLQQALMHQLESGYSEADFDVRPSALECVEVIGNLEQERFARIYRHRASGLYEVRYFVRVPARPEIRGYSLPERWEVLTLAEDLASAQYAAETELAQFAAQPPSSSF